MNPEETYEIQPLKKAHPIFNSLVIKIILTVVAILWNYSSLSPTERAFVLNEDVYLRFVVAFILILLCLSFAEALGLWLLGLLRKLYMHLNKSN